MGMPDSMEGKSVVERRLCGERFGRTHRDIVERRCMACGETKVTIREYEVKTDEEAMAEFFSTDA